MVSIVFKLSRIILKLETIFPVLSLWQCHCHSSPGSFDEWTTASHSCQHSGTKPTNLSCYHLHPPTITSCMYNSASFYHTTEGRWSNQPRHCGKGVQGESCISLAFTTHCTHWNSYLISHSYFIHRNDISHTAVAAVPQGPTLPASHHLDIMLSADPCVQCRAVWWHCHTQHICYCKTCIFREHQIFAIWVKSRY